MKIIADSFTFSQRESNVEEVSAFGSFAYLKESHTSVVGMRECFKNQVPCFAMPIAEVLKTLEQAHLPQAEGCAGQYIPEDDFEEISQYEKELKMNHQDNKTTSQCSQQANENDSLKGNLPNSLFVFPAQCNFSGYKYPLELISAIQEGVFSTMEEKFCLNPRTLKSRSPLSNWFCLLDAASFAATNHLNLSVWKPDMVVISFYKMFGYPTGKFKVKKIMARNDNNTSFF